MLKVFGSIQSNYATWLLVACRNQHPIFLIVCIVEYVRVTECIVIDIGLAALERILRQFLPTHKVTADRMHDIFLGHAAPVKARVKRMVKTVFILHNRAGAQRRILGKFIIGIVGNNFAVMVIIGKILGRPQAPRMETCVPVTQIFQIEDTELLTIIKRHGISYPAIAGVRKKCRICTCL